MKQKEYDISEMRKLITIHYDMTVGTVTKLNDYFHKEFDEINNEIADMQFRIKNFEKRISELEDKKQFFKEAKA